MPTVIRDPTPSWLKKENASVFDSPTIQAIRWLAGMIGADDPQSQVLGLMNPTEVGPAGGLAGAMQRLAAKGKKPITAYHGSPHDFDKFSTANIGTGEGAQAYGHGLYFAERPDTAQAYRKTLSHFGHASEMPDNMTKSVLLDGKVVSGSTPSNQLTPLERAALAKHYEGGIQARAIDQVKDTLKYLTPGSPSHTQELETLDALMKNDLTGRVQPFTGRTYEVNIHADPEDFLDWDQPLSQQSVAVQTELGTRLNSRELGLTGSQRFGGAPTGEDIYTRLGRPGVASNFLKEIKIPGIKYLDQGSRAAGKGTRNYVVFDAQIIDIMKKYGVPAAVAASLARSSQEPGR